MKKKYIVPSIKTRHIETVMPLCVSGDEPTGVPSNDLGTTPQTGSADGGSALSKRNIVWDDENEW